MATFKTYSFKDTSGALSSGVVAVIPFEGQQGVHSIQVAMSQEKTVLDTASDGTIMPSFIAGDSGVISIEMQQTSIMHALLLAWYNALKTLALAGNPTQWAANSITFRNNLDTSQYVATGVAPMKIPDRPYAQQGQHITWQFMCCDIQQVTLGVGT